MEGGREGRGFAVCREGGGKVESCSLLVGEGTDAGRWLTYCPELTRANNNNWKVQPDFTSGHRPEINSNEQNESKILPFISLNMMI